MILALRPRIVAALLGLVAFLPTSVNAGMTPAEVKEFEETKAKAEKGNPVAQFNLGVMYFNGEGAPKDKAEAVKWYRRAAEKEIAQAQAALGFCYEKGTGIAKDDEECVKWYRKAAEQGLAIAQHSLGLCYANGRGVAKDEVQAVKYFRKAAEQGHALALYSLGVFYEKGAGAPKDEIEAYAHYNLSGITFEPARDNLASLERQMSLEARHLGQQRTKQLQKEIEEKMAAGNAGK